jgi:hypothetical protein
MTSSSGLRYHSVYVVYGARGVRILKQGLLILLAGYVIVFSLSFCRLSVALMDNRLLMQRDSFVK